MKELRLLIGVHLKEFFREPGIIFWAILFPVLMALGLGMAFSGGGEALKTIAIVSNSNEPFNGLLDNDHNDEWTRRIGNDKMGYTTYTFQKVQWDESIEMLKQGKVSLIIKAEGDSLQYHFDPSNVDAKMSYMQLSSTIKGTNGEEVAAEVHILKQEGTRYVDFLIPGLMAMGIMMSCMWGISYNNVDKRNKKLLRRMVATPMRKTNYVAAQLTARAMLTAVEAIILFTVTALIFDIKITGSIPGLFLMFLTGNMAFAGIAMLLSSRTSNTQIANGLINLMVLPMMILSGIYFSYHNFPDFMIPIIQVLPLTILADNMRSIFLEGKGFIEILPGAGFLALIGLVFFGVGIKAYKWY